MSVRIAIDVGGTFTDLVGYDEKSKKLVIAKESTTPADFSAGVLEALAKSCVDPGRVDRFFANGSTIVINALTERKGARTALLTTRGFRDVLEIQRSNRPDVYNFNYRKPRPFIPRDRIGEITERLDERGEIVESLRLEELAEHLNRWRGEGVEAVGICFFNAYANDSHERRCADEIRKQWPAVFVCCSHELTQEYREYERTNTTVLNAFVQPVVSDYLKNLEQGLGQRGVTARLYAMASNGGVMSFRSARQGPVHMVESGPVAGAIGARALGNHLNRPNLITLDVGGTTAKTTLIHQNTIRINTDYFIEKTTTFAGYPLKVPAIDIVEIGSGGGSILWQDEGGTLRVGPRSAGAVPGPVSYARGGTEPTLTDAFLLSGVLNPEYFLGGEVLLKVEPARAAYKKMAARFKLSVEDLAQGAVRLANAQMVNALKLVSVKRGYDPRDFVLVAFGGGGPLHASSVARELGIRQVIIPPLPGVFSAWGMLMANLRRDFLRTSLMPLDSVAPERLNRIFKMLEQQAKSVFRSEGYLDHMRTDRYVDARYRGQEHTVKVPLAAGVFHAAGIESLRQSFGDLHEQAYQFRLDDPLEVVNCHLVAYARLSRPSFRSNFARGRRRLTPKGIRDVFLERRRLKASVYERSDLQVGSRLNGPVIVEEPTSTTMVNLGDRLSVDDFGNLLIEIQESL